MEEIRENESKSRKKAMRSLLRDKYWTVTNDTSPDTEECHYKKIKISDKLISFMTPRLRRYYRKINVISESLIISPSNYSNTSNMVENQNTYVDGSSAGLIHTIPLSPITCMYTDRLLKPFIFQDFESNPLWLKMHSELRSKLTHIFPKYKIKNYKKHPISYMYIQKEHIPAINALAEIYFWPGIDVSSALWYPEFSCVAIYKKLVVGFGIMAPGLHLNEAYISFLFVRPHWRCSGIATFILYHLIQTCVSWNISLHTCISNEAIFLYNKFTFKIHKMIRNFYGGRLPINSNISEHANYMLLEKYISD